MPARDEAARTRATTAQRGLTLAAAWLAVCVALSLVAALAYVSIAARHRLAPALRTLGFMP